MNTSCLLSIIIVSYNGESVLKKCLTSLDQDSDKRNLMVEIIVVDNDSSDGSVQMIEQNFPRVILIKNSNNVGFGVANNIASKKASGEYLLFLNPDTVSNCDIVEETLSFFRKHPDDKSAFGGMLIDSDGKEQRGCRRSFPTVLNAFLHFTKLTKIIKYQKAYDLSGLTMETHKVECVSGACIGIPKVMYQELGGFDERFFLHFEDIDLCKRIWEAGYTLWFYPRVKVMHIKGVSSNSSQKSRVKVNQWFLESLLKYLWKWDKIGGILFIPLFVVLRLVSSARNWSVNEIK